MSRMIGATRRASVSACSSATRFGTTSPAMRVTKVMISTTMPLATSSVYWVGTP